MSPLPSLVVLDTTVISSLHLARALSRVLGLWKGKWIVPLQVRDEAAAWKSHGPDIAAMLDSLRSRGVIDYASPNPGPEGTLFTRLQRTRGQGESAAITIAYHRGGAVATDDRRARRSCEGLNPPVTTFATEALLTLAVQDGLLTRTEARQIWRTTGIRDPKRGIGT
jgi:predicted nucleic acid-binding protein